MRAELQREEETQKIREATIARLQKEKVAAQTEKEKRSQEQPEGLGALRTELSNLHKERARIDEEIEQEKKKSPRDRKKIRQLTAKREAINKNITVKNKQKKKLEETLAGQADSGAKVAVATPEIIPDAPMEVRGILQPQFAEEPPASETPDLGVETIPPDKTRTEKQVEKPPLEEKETEEPQKEEKERLEKEIKALPKEEKEKLSVGLGNIGFLVEKKKNEFFANIFDFFSRTNLNQNKTTARFTKALANGFVRDAKIAEKKMEEIYSGKQKHRVGNVVNLGKNIVRYGRILTDFTGRSLVSPLRYVMLGAMAFTRGAEAATEARLTNEKIIEKTRINDAERAAEEAWRIYEQAQEKSRNRGKAEISAEVLRDTYLAEIPKDLQKRLEAPDVANDFIQNILKKQLTFSLSRINTAIEKIDKNPNLDKTQKEREKEKLLKRWEKALTDYDRIITQYGTIDELAMAGRYAQIAGKTVVGIATLETIFLSIEKVIESATHLISASHQAVESILQDHSAVVHTVVDTSHATPDSTAMDSLHANVDSAGTELHPDTVGIAHDSLNMPAEHPDTTVEGAGVHSEIPQAPPAEHIALNQDAIVGKGEGVEHVLRRQIEHNEDIARALGYKGDMGDQDALREFSGRMAHQKAVEGGFTNWINEANKEAFQLKINPDQTVGIEHVNVEGGKVMESTSDMTEEARARLLKIFDGDQSAKLSNTEVPPFHEPELRHPSEIKGFDETKLPHEVPHENLTGDDVAHSAPGRFKGAFASDADRDHYLEARAGLEHSYGANHPDVRSSAFKGIPPNPRTYEEYLEQSRMLQQNDYMLHGQGGGMPGGGMFISPEAVARQIDIVYEHNLDHMFPNTGDPGMTEAIERILNENATDIMNIEKSEQGVDKILTPVSDYVKQLEKVSGLKPRGETLTRQAETVSEYIRRAIGFVMEKRPDKLAKIMLRE